LTSNRRPFTRGTASTVAAPIRFPTIVTRSLTAPRLTVANSTGIGGRAAVPRPPPGPAAPVADAPSRLYSSTPATTSTTTTARMTSLRIGPGYRVIWTRWKSTSARW
jgi:hypothetical protein